MNRHGLWLGALCMTLLPWRPALAAPDADAGAALKSAVKLRGALVQPGDFGTAFKNKVTPKMAAAFLCQGSESVQGSADCDKAALRIFPDGRFEGVVDKPVDSFCLQDPSAGARWAGPLVVSLETDAAAAPRSTCFVAEPNKRYAVTLTGGISSVAQLRIWGMQGFVQGGTRGPKAFAPQAVKAATEEAKRQFKRYVLSRWEAMVTQGTAEQDAARLGSWRKAREVAVRGALGRAAGRYTAAAADWDKKQEALLKEARAAFEAEPNADSKRAREATLKELQRWVVSVSLKLTQGQQQITSAQKLMGDAGEPQSVEASRRIDGALGLLDEASALIKATAVAPPALEEVKDALLIAQETLKVLRGVTSKTGRLSWSGLQQLLEEAVAADLASEAEALARAVQAADGSNPPPRKAARLLLEQVAGTDTLRGLIEELEIGKLDDKGDVEETRKKYLKGQLAADIPSPHGLIERLGTSEATYVQALRRLGSAHQPGSLPGATNGLPWLIFDGSIPIPSDKLASGERPAVYALAPSQGRRSRRESFIEQRRILLFGYNLRRPSKAAPATPGATDAAGAGEGAPASAATEPGDDVAILVSDIPRPTEVGKFLATLFVLADAAMATPFFRSGEEQEALTQVSPYLNTEASKDLIRKSSEGDKVVADTQAPERDVQYGGSLFTSKTLPKLLTSTESVSSKDSEGIRHRLVICSGVPSCGAGNQAAPGAITAEVTIDVMKRHRWFGVLTELAYFHNRAADAQGRRGLPLGGYSYQQVGGFGGPSRLYELRGDYSLANKFAFSALAAFYPVAAWCKGAGCRGFEGLALAFGPTFARTNGGEFGKQWNFRIGYEFGRSSVLLLAGLALRRIDVPVYQTEGQVISFAAAPSADDLKFATEQRNELLFSIGLGLDLAVLGDALQLLRTSLKDKKPILPDAANSPAKN